jgi:hypothetical protein
MNNKKISFIIVFIAIASFFSVAIFYYFIGPSQGERGNAGQTERMSETNVPTVSCTYDHDEHAYNSAVEMQDVQICDCIADMEMRASCQIDVNDMIIHERSLSEEDVVICDDITDEDLRIACQSNITTRAEHMQSVIEAEEALAAQQLASDEYMGDLEIAIEDEE